MHRYHLDLVDWARVKQIAEMVESRTMERGDLRFGPLKVTIYSVTGQGTLRMDFREEA